MEITWNHRGIDVQKNDATFGPEIQTHQFSDWSLRLVRSGVRLRLLWMLGFFLADLIALHASRDRKDAAGFFFNFRQFEFAEKTRAAGVPHQVKIQTLDWHISMNGAG